MKISIMDGMIMEIYRQSKNVFVVAAQNSVIMDLKGR